MQDQNLFADQHNTFCKILREKMNQGRNPKPGFFSESFAKEKVSLGVMQIRLDNFESRYF